MTEAKGTLAYANLCKSKAMEALPLEIPQEPDRIARLERMVVALCRAWNIEVPA
jgi:hypothetical protein